MTIRPAPHQRLVVDCKAPRLRGVRLSHVNGDRHIVVKCNDQLDNRKHCAEDRYWENVLHIPVCWPCVRACVRVYAGAHEFLCVFYVSAYACAYVRVHVHVRMRRMRGLACVRRCVCTCVRVSVCTLYASCMLVCVFAGANEPANSARRICILNINL